jgi:hypothetical protein
MVNIPDSKFEILKQTYGSFGATYWIFYGAYILAFVWLFAVYMEFISVPKNIIYLPSFFLLSLIPTSIAAVKSGSFAPSVSSVTVFASLIISCLLSFCYTSKTKVDKETFSETHTQIKCAYLSTLSLYFKSLLFFMLLFCIISPLSSLIIPLNAYVFIMTHPVYYNLMAGLGWAIPGLCLGKSLFLTQEIMASE